MYKLSTNISMDRIRSVTPDSESESRPRSNHSCNLTVSARPRRCKPRVSAASAVSPPKTTTPRSISQRSSTLAKASCQDIKSPAVPVVVINSLSDGIRMVVASSSVSSALFANGSGRSMAIPSSPLDTSIVKGFVSSCWPRPNNKRASKAVAPVIESLSGTPSSSINAAAVAAPSAVATMR